MEIYLDNSATSKPCKESVAACMNTLEKEYGNPSSLHKKGFEAEKIVLKSKSELSSALSCEDSEIVFTSGATEANNLALIGCAMANCRRGKTIITTAIEHPSVLKPAEYLKKQGFHIKQIAPNCDGKYTPDMFKDAVDDDTVLVSAMFVNNETGLILPVFEIAHAVKRKNPNALFHTDAVQGFLKLPIKLKNSDIDLLSVSGHKVYAPKGIGALYIKHGVRLNPLIYGGGQQNGIRSGTETVPLIAAFGAAVETYKNQIVKNRSHYQKLKCRLMEKAAQMEEIKINSLDSCAPHIVSMTVQGIRSEILLHFLEQRGIYVSSGSACAKGKPSYVLTALGMKKPDSDETIRVSFAPQTTDKMIDELIQGIEDGLHSLQKRRTMKNTF